MIWKEQMDGECEKESKCPDCGYDTFKLFEIGTFYPKDDDEADETYYVYLLYCHKCGRPIKQKYYNKEELDKIIRSSLQEHDIGFLWKYEELNKGWYPKDNLNMIIDFIEEKTDWWGIYPNMHWWFFYQRNCKNCWETTWQRVLLTQNIPVNSDRKNSSRCMVCGGSNFDNKSFCESMKDKIKWYFTYRGKGKTHYPRTNKARVDFTDGKITFKEYKELTREFIW